MNSIVNPNTVLSMGREVASVLPSSEEYVAISSNFMNVEEDTSKEESSDSEDSLS